MATHVLLPAALLAWSPSREDGVSQEDEQTHRFWGCELIEEAGVLLRLPQVVMVTAQTMLHRFYYRKSLKDFDAFRVAIGCLFLAAKVEEQPKRIKDVLAVFYAIYRRRKWGKTRLAQQLLHLESDSYYLWRDWLVMVERQILIDLGFSLYNIMEHPHKYILYYIKILDGSKELAQKAWGYLNDSLRINLCVRFRAEVIACAAIFIAARQLQVKLPDAPVWYELFDVDHDSLVTVVMEILELYKRPKIVWLTPLTQVDPFAIDDLPDTEPSSEAANTACHDCTQGEVELENSVNNTQETAAPAQSNSGGKEKSQARSEVDQRGRARRERSQSHDGRRRSTDRERSRDGERRSRRRSRSTSRSRDRSSRDSHRRRRSRSRSRSSSYDRKRSHSRRERSHSRDRRRR